MVQRLITVALLLMGTAAHARPVVVELFTSESCSSCPPAEALLRQLGAADPGILPLSFHVTYWNGAAWTDSYSLPAATDRQGWYARLAGEGELYTPEAVVDGGHGVIGSDAGLVTAAIATAKAAAAGGVGIALTDGAAVTVSLGAGTARAMATALLVGYDPAHVTQIGGGENAGATVAEVNVVRSLTRLGAWNGTAETFSVPRPVGQRLAVLVQDADGRIEGAATN